MSDNALMETEPHGPYPLGQGGPGEMTVTEDGRWWCWVGSLVGIPGAWIPIEDPVVRGMRSRVRRVTE